jgi:hypothetical protein
VIDKLILLSGTTLWPQGISRSKKLTDQEATRLIWVEIAGSNGVCVDNAQSHPKFCASKLLVVTA